MATVATLSANLAAAIVAFAGSPVRLASDFLEEHEAIPLGATRFQIRTFGAGETTTDSNIQYQVAVIELVFAHRLTNPLDERAFTLGNMQTHLATLSDSAFYRGLASVHELLEAPEFTVERLGHVIRYTAATRVSLVP